MIFMEQAEKLMAQEVDRMDKKSEHVRIPVLLRINNPRHLLQVQAPEEVTKSIIHLEIEEGQVLQKKAMWLEMKGK